MTKSDESSGVCDISSSRCVSDWVAPRNFIARKYYSLLKINLAYYFNFVFLKYPIYFWWKILVQKILHAREFCMCIEISNKIFFCLKIEIFIIFETWNMTKNLLHLHLNISSKTHFYSVMNEEIDLFSLLESHSVTSKLCRSTQASSIYSIQNQKDFSSLISDIITHV